jgi:flagellar biosynthetic protein FliR
LIPINGAVFDKEHLLNSMVTFMGNYLTIGFRICLPVFCAMILLNAILGIMAKVSPQMNMFAVGIQLKMLVGIGVLLIAVTMLPSAADFIFTQMKVIVVDFVEGMT